MKYKYRKTIKVIQPDGSYKRGDVKANTEKELKQKIHSMIEKAELNYYRASNPTFSDIADKWYAHHIQEVEHNTAECYIAPLKDLKKEFGDTLMAELTPLDVQVFLNRLKMQGYAKQTIKLRKITCNLVCDYAIVNNILQINPCDAVKVPKAPKKIVNLPPDDDIAEIKKHIDCDMGLLAYFIMFTGMRRGEALATRYEDIDFDNNIIVLNNNIYYVNNKPKIKTPKTVNGIRTIPLLTPLKNVLNSKGHGYIFSHDGDLKTVYSESYITKEWRKYKRKYNVTSTLHQLRHVFATFCYDAELPEKDTQMILGHSKIETTKNIYTHIKESRRKVSADALNDYVKSI